MTTLALLIILVPLLAAPIAALLPEGALPRVWGFAVGVVLLLLTVAAGFTVAAPGLDLRLPELPAEVAREVAQGADLGVAGLRGFSVKVAPIDAISWWLVLLTALMLPVVALASKRVAPGRQRGYFAWVLMLVGSILGVFLARDLLLFYVFFELTLVPAFFLIGDYGEADDRRQAATKFVVYTFAGSVFMLAGILLLGTAAGSFDFDTVGRYAATHTDARGVPLGVVGLLLLAGFAVKVPLVPLHTWQPQAYTAAPAPVTALLSAVLAKLGTYGLLRVLVPMGLTDASGPRAWLITLIGVLAAVAILYAAGVALVQTDFKRLVAYSSVSHLGYCVLGVVALDLIGAQGGLLYMVNHGVAAAGLFLLLGFLETRMRTREFGDATGPSGLARSMPVFSFFLVLFALANVGLPGLSGFVSEYLSLQGAYRSPHLGLGYAIVGVIGMVLGAAYMLRLVGALVFGPERVPDGGRARDLTWAEVAAVAPLAVLVLYLGVKPNDVLNSTKAPLARTLAPLDAPAALVADAR